MTFCMSEKEAIKLASKMNALIDREKHKAIVKTNWAGRYFVGVGKVKE